MIFNGCDYSRQRQLHHRPVQCRPGAGHSRIAIKSTHWVRTDSNNEIVLTLPNPEDTEGYDGYTVDTARDTLTAFIEEEQVPELSLVSSSAASSFNGESRLHSAANNHGVWHVERRHYTGHSDRRRARRNSIV